MVRRRAARLWGLIIHVSGAYTDLGPLQFTPPFNGVQGYAWVERHSDLNLTLSSFRGRPGCADVTLAELVIDAVKLSELQLVVRELDAVAIGYGQRVFP